MIRIDLNGKKMINKKLAHEYLKWKLNSPEYHGENLDALWDILTSWDMQTEISLINTEDIIENLGGYGESLIAVFQDAENENDNISLKLYDRGQ